MWRRRLGHIFRLGKQLQESMQATLNKLLLRSVSHDWKNVEYDQKILCLLQCFICVFILIADKRIIRFVA